MVNFGQQSGADLGLGRALDDPGDMGDIDPATSGYILMNAFEGAETRDLVEAARAGLVLTLIAGGANAITVTAGDPINAAGDLTIQFTAATQRVVLMSNASLQWKLWVNDGAAIPAPEGEE